MEISNTQTELSNNDNVERENTLFAENSHQHPVYIQIIIAILLLLILREICDIGLNIRKHKFLKSNLFQLHKAINDCNTIKVVDLIQKRPQYVNEAIFDDGFTPFLRACYTGNTFAIQVMLALGADIRSKTSSGENGFYLATYWYIINGSTRNANVLHALYHAGLDIDERNCFGLNALQLAVLSGNDKLVIWLLTKGADPTLIKFPYTTNRIRFKVYQ